MILYLLSFLLINSVSSCRILSMSGGGSHGAFEAGVVEHLVLQNNTWDVLAGVSAGSLNAAFISRYHSIYNASQSLRDIWYKLDNSDVYKFKPNKLYILNSDPLRDTINRHLDYTVANKSLYPTLIGMTNIQNGNFHIENIENKEDITDILMSSSAIPVIFPPINYQDQLYIDGGTVSNEIISQAIDYCLQDGDQNITMDLILTYNPYMKFNNLPPTNIVEYLEGVLKIIYNNYNDMTFKLLNNCKYSQKVADVNLYYPDQDIHVSLLDFRFGSELYQLGINNFKQEKHLYC